MTAPSSVLGEGRERRQRRGGSRPAPVYAVASPKAPSGILRRLLILESVTLSVVWTIAFLTALAPVWPESTFVTAAGLGLCVLVLTVSGLLMAAVLQLYRSRVSALRSVTVERQALLAATSTLEAAALLHVLAPAASTTPIIVGGLALFVGLAVGRSGFDSWLTVLRRTGAIGRPVVLVGQPVETAALVDLLASHPEIGYRPVGYVGPQRERSTPTDVAPELPWLGPARLGGHRRPPGRGHRRHHRGQRPPLEPAQRRSSASSTPPASTCTCRAASSGSATVGSASCRWPTSRSSTSSRPLRRGAPWP